MVFPLHPTKRGHLSNLLRMREVWKKLGPKAKILPQLPVARNLPVLPFAPASKAPRAFAWSSEREGERIFKAQKEVISAWIADPDHPANETYRYPLELYAQLNDSEFAYVSELQGIYDETCCFFLQWLLGKEIKELVNSARISAVQNGKPFTWAHARAETLKSITDVTLTARFLALSRLNGHKEQLQNYGSPKYSPGKHF
jgi:hypothetical protein